nr:uncharacterized protein LOC113824484 [Penaeus vannamei]
MNSTHVFFNNDGEEREFITRRKLQSIRNRTRFLKECVKEQVLPRSAPPPPISKCYLREGISECIDEMEMLRSRLPGIHLPHRLVLELRKEDESQKARHKRLLEVACTNNGWSKVVRDDMIIKLSHKPLTDTQRNLSALERGFLQGVVTCAVAAAKDREPAIPARYTRTLQELGRDESIVIAPADKGGGVVIIDNTDYVSKMEILLSDVSTYRKAKRGNAEERSLEFNRATKKVLRGSEKGKSMLHLLEETPRVPTIRGSIKTHKEGNPVRPITNGTGSAPHRLAKKLAAPLSAALNSISGCHLSNTSDMMAKLQGVGMKCKKLVKKLELPLRIDDYIELTRLCVEFGPKRKQIHLVYAPKVLPKKPYPDKEQRGTKKYYIPHLINDSPSKY